jgi:lysozyme
MMSLRFSIKTSSLFVGSLGLVLTLGACGSPLPEEGDEPGTLQEEARVCPGSTQLQGIDVSYYQGNIDWAKVKASGRQFAIVRASDGTGFVDPKFTANWKGAKAAGLAVGAYQFFRPTQDVNAQADLMIKMLNSVGYGAGDLPPVIDVEVTDGVSGSTVASRVNAWISRVKSGTGRLPSLYTSPGFWSGIGNPTPSTLPYIWVAHWGVSCPTLPPAWGRLRFWQYSSKGSVPGISGNVDLDIYNGTLSELRGL